jgi:hypothetical protein
MKRLLIATAGLAAAAVAMKKCSRQRDRWNGLSETDAREKLDHRLPSRMPDERRAAVTDKIIGRMRDRGMIDPDAELDIAADDADGDLDLTVEPVETDDDATVKA